MPEHYNKPALTFEQQLAHLKERGLEISSTNNALHTLATISYYRLSGYWYPFRYRDAKGKIYDHFISGASLDEAVALYEFAQNTDDLTSNTDEFAPYTDNLTPNIDEFAPNTGDLAPYTGDLPAGLQKKLGALTPKARKHKVWPVLVWLCALRPYTAEQLSTLLDGRQVKTLRSAHLNPLREHEKLIAYTHPEVINHPEQAYQVTAKGLSWLKQQGIHVDD